MAEIIRVAKSTDRQRKKLEDSRRTVGLYKGKLEILPAGYDDAGKNEERHMASFD